MNALSPTNARQGGAVAKFVSTSVIGGFFFLCPVRVSGQWTIPFDVATTAIQDANASAGINLIGHYATLVIVMAALLSLGAVCQKHHPAFASGFDMSYFRTGWTFLAVRVLGAVIAVMLDFQIGPEFVLSDSTGGMMFDTLVASVALIVPIGAVFITLFVAFGALDFTGTLMRPLMRPLFRVPGRGALDGIASFVGSYSVGLYVTNLVYRQGRYTAREASIIATCFSTVSIGFVAVVCGTLGLNAYFPHVFGATTVVSAILAIILCRVPPLSRKPDTYAAATEADPEPEHRGRLWSKAVQEGVAAAHRAGSVHGELGKGLVDGLKLSGVILPSIMAIGLGAVCVAEYTPIFDWLGAPLVPVLALLGIPDAGVVAPASLIGITEMFLPSLLVTGAALPAKFFIAVLSLTQLMFFSATIPLMLELDVPVRLRDCLLLFVWRTALSIPLIAGITHLLFSL